MEEEKFTFRQKWFPTLDDAEELTEKRYDKKNKFSTGDFPVIDFFGRWARTLILSGALLWAGYNVIGNNIEYSKGERVGVINKVSEKGLIWKTQEGQLSLEGRTSTGDSTGAGVWDFSIDASSKNNNELYSKIKKAMENGDRVKITYNQPLATWPWRAKTNYLVEDVESLETKE